MDTVRVSAAIIYRDGHVLAARREDVEAPGGWEFPGGKIEDGEAPEQALRREIAEELGCSLQLVWLYDTIEHDYPDFHLSMDCFVCTLAPGQEPRATSHAELRWVDRDDLLDLEWLPADMKLVGSLGYMWDDAFEDQHL